VPAVAAAMLVASGEWDAGKMVNVEELPPLPFLSLLNRIGLPTRIRDEKGDRALTFQSAMQRTRIPEGRKAPIAGAERARRFG
jgi:hypothetical protein